MSHKRKGQLTVSGEWARHLRPFLRRVFWKGERQAEKVLVRTEEGAVEKVRASAGTVEDLLAKVKAVPVGTTAFDLWVPERLTFQGNEITPDVAMAIVLDNVLDRGLFPNGFVLESGGRLYQYRTE